MPLMQFLCVSTGSCSPAYFRYGIAAIIPPGRDGLLMIWGLTPTHKRLPLSGFLKKELYSPFRAHTGGLLLSLADGINISFRCSSAVRAEKALFSFCSYLRLWFRYWANVRAESTLNASATASPTVAGNFTEPRSSTKNTKSNFKILTKQFEHLPIFGNFEQNLKK